MYATNIYGISVSYRTLEGLFAILRHIRDMRRTKAA